MKLSKKLLTNPGYKNIVFDCDSTLTYIEGADEIARLKGLGEEVAKITHRGMNGEINFAKSLYKRLDLIRPSLKDIDFLYRQYVGFLLADVPEVIGALNFIRKNIHIVTGGYQQAVVRLAGYLGIRKSRVFGVHLKFGKSEDFIGFKKNHLTRNGGKAKVLRKIKKSGSTLFIGDGVTDLEAEGEVDLFVGFGGVIEREAVKSKAAFYVKSSSLSWVLPLSCSDREAQLLKNSEFSDLYGKGYNILRKIVRN